MQPLGPHVPRLDFTKESCIPALQACIAVGTFVMFVLPDGMKMKKHVGRLIGERKNSKNNYHKHKYRNVNYLDQTICDRNEIIA